MATPNAMPRNNNPVRQAVAHGVTAISPSVRKHKKLVDGEVEETTVVSSGLRFPLAQNLSEESASRLAEQWL